MKLFYKSYFFLFDRKTPALKYCLITWLLTTIPALAIMRVITFIFNISDDEKINAVHFDDLFNIFKNVLLNPALETFIIAFYIHWLKQIFENSFYIVISSTLLFAVLHFKLEYPFWFFGVLWPSFTISAAYLTWKSISFWKAYSVCTAIHILNNGTIYILVQFFGAV
jgi:hypothetical protein